MARPSWYKRWRARQQKRAEAQPFVLKLLLMELGAWRRHPEPFSKREAGRKRREERRFKRREI
jgi:prophage tail gpP-like protein